MKLRSIELSGFKSFPDKTKIDFHDGMTAIVGPNGSGKSNVTDAVRWVLGEQSAKILRGKKMEDLIFSGTQNRRQMSFAQVSLNFDNQDQSIKLPYDEVKISRRLYRSGEAEYEINGNSCRLKDIQELFFDTGIGKDGYAIIGQGRVDELLSAKSEDRRRIFDEAAGISKYRSQKDEAIRKLNVAGENLARLDDILNELSLQMQPLIKQATKAEKYLLLEDELKACEISSCIAELNKLEEDEARNQAEIQIIENDLSNFQDKKINLDKQNMELKQEQERMDISLQENQDGIYTALVNWENIKTQKTLASEQLKFLQENYHKLQQVLTDGVKYKENLLLELEELKKKSAQKEEELQYWQRNLLVSESELAELKTKLGEDDLQREKIQEDIISCQEEYFQLKTQASEADYAYKNNKELIDKLHEEIKKKSVLCQENDKLLQTLEQEVEFLEIREAEQSQVLNTKQAELKAAEEKFANCEQELNTKHNTILNNKYKLETQVALQKKYEGYQQAVRNLLTYDQIPGELKKNICGTIAEILKVDPIYVQAIDTALAGILQNIVVLHKEDAAGLIKILKNEKMGRVTFLPLNFLNTSPLDDHILQECRKIRGFIDKASNLVHIKEQLIKRFNKQVDFDNLLKYLLDKIFVCQDLDTALKIAKLSEQKYKVVSLDGDLIHAGGAMSGGSFGKEKIQLLSREFEIERLQAEIRIMEEEQLILSNSRLELLEQVDILNEHFEVLKENFAENKADKLTKSLYLEQKRQEKVLLQAELKQAESQLNHLEKISTKHHNDSKNLSVQADRLQQRLLKLKEELSHFHNFADEQKHILNNKKDEISEQKIKIAQARSDLNNLSKEKDRLKKDEDLLGRETELKKQELISLQKEIAVKEKNLLEYEIELEKQGQEKNKLEEKQLALQENLNNLKKLQMKQDDDISALLSDIYRLDGAKNKLSDRISLQKEQKINLMNELWDAHELTYFNCLNLYDTYVKDKEINNQETGLQDIPLWCRIYESKDGHFLKQEIKRLRTELKELGPVNVEAIEQLKHVKERHSFISTQHEDLILAKAELNSVIAQLNKKMKEIFVSSFEKINQSFNEVFGSLFLGGEARLVLENPDDALNSNIEIKVSPPGKRLQNMLLLSGGERSLAAIALLFAILSLRPAPFVVLDEIEAALDEANVHRFANYIRKYSQISQFIIVTHRKGTMEACERIYGVTMQEKGVSSLLSLKLQQ